MSCSRAGSAAGEILVAGLSIRHLLSCVRLSAPSWIMLAAGDVGVCARGVCVCARVLCLCTSPPLPRATIATTTTPAPAPPPNIANQMCVQCTVGLGSHDLLLGKPMKNPLTFPIQAVKRVKRKAALKNSSSFGSTSKYNSIVTPKCFIT